MSRNSLAGAIAAGVLLIVTPVALAAPVARQTTSFKYKGKSITPSRAAAKGLVCVEGRPGNKPARCFDRTTTAHAALDPYPDGPGICASQGYLSLYQDTFFGGWEVRLSARQVWYDLTTAYDNQASSYKMGNHSGHIASEKYVNGLGYYYPGPTGVNDCDTRMSRYAYHDVTWNNKASSRYRN